MLTNVCNPEKVREVQLKVLGLLRNHLEKSFGPKGSNTAIFKDEFNTTYTKDGHNILKAIDFKGAVELSVKSLIEDLTRTMVTKVGDGTTSTVILSEILFRKITEYIDNNTKYTPYDINEAFVNISNEIKEEIMANAQPITRDATEHIAYISTNGNAQISKIIADLYDKYEENLFINVETSTDDRFFVRESEGFIIDEGMAESAFVNKEDGSCIIEQPCIFTFTDPIDTPMLGGYMQSIINNCFANHVPTVLFAPRISRDFSAVIKTVADNMLKLENIQKPQLLIVTNFEPNSSYYDMIEMIGAKPIKKYIDANIYQQDLKDGKAPDNKTIVNFFGRARQVKSTYYNTTILDGANYRDAEGNYSDSYIALKNFLTGQIDKARRDGEDSTVTVLTKRLRALDSSVVDLIVGGISLSDRDSLKDLVDDAVYNCRAAHKSGYGRGANVEGLCASYIVKKNKSFYTFDKAQLDIDISTIIFESFKELITSLIKVNTGETDDKAIDDIIYRMLDSDDKLVFNVKTQDFDDTVLSSILSDYYIIDSLSKIIPIMATSNQFLVPDFRYNEYI